MPNQLAPPVPYDLLLDPVPDTDDGLDHRNLGLLFVRDPGMGSAYTVTPDPGIETTENPVYASFSGGMGASEQYVPGMYGWTLGGCTRVPGMVLPGGKVTEVTPIPALEAPVRQMIRFDGDVLFFGDRYIRVSVGGTGAVVLSQDLGFNVVTGIGQPSIFNGSLFVPTHVGSTGAAFSLWRNDTAIWTDHPTVTMATLGTVYWDVGGQGAHRLLAIDGSGKLQWCASDPTVLANWGPVPGITPTTDGSSINLIVTSAKHAYLVGGSGAWDIDARAHVSLLTPYFKHALNEANGIFAIIYDGDLYVNRGNGIDRIPLGGQRVDIPEHINPGMYSGDASPVFGYPRAMVIENGWLCTAFWNPHTDTSYLCYARRTDQGWQWHGSEAEFSGIVSCMFIDSPSSGAARLWVCTESPNKIFWVSLPFSGNAYQDLVHGGSHRFQSEFSLFVPDGWQAPTSRRVPYRYDVHADRLGGANQISVYANRDKEVDSSDDLVWDLEGTTYTSPRATFIAQQVRQSCYRVDFQVAASGDETNPPLLRAFAPYADVNREQMKIYSMRFWIEAGQSLRGHNGADPQDAEILLENLWALTSEQATPVTAIGPQGQELTVQILPGLTIEERENRTGHYGKLVTMRIRVLYGVFYWDSGITYESDAIYV